MLLILAQGQISNTLQEVSVPILSNTECRKSGYGSTRITDNMLCAGYKDGEKDSCQVSWLVLKLNIEGFISSFFVSKLSGRLRWSTSHQKQYSLSCCRSS